MITESNLICALLYVRGHGYIGVVELGLFDRAPIALLIEVEEGVPVFGAYGHIDGVEDPQNPLTLFTCFGATAEIVCNKLVTALRVKLGIKLIEAA